MEIDKRDERGRTIDVHAFRHTFGTLLSKGGVSPRTAQAAMRHSTINLTMNIYTDPKLLDVAGAVEALPSLPLGDRKMGNWRHESPQGQRGPPIDPLPVCTRVCTNHRQNPHIAVNLDKIDRQSREAQGDRHSRRNCLSRQKKRPADNGCQRVAFSGADRDRTGNLLVANQGLSQLSYGPSGASTRCTGLFVWHI